MSATHIQFQPFDDDDGSWVTLTSIASPSIRNYDSDEETCDETLSTAAVRETNLKISFAAIGADDVPSTPIIFWRRGSKSPKSCPYKDKDPRRCDLEEADTGEEEKEGEAGEQDPTLLTEEIREELAQVKLEHQEALQELQLTQEVLACFRNSGTRTCIEDAVDEIKTELEAARLQRELTMDLKHALAARELERTKNELKRTQREHEQANTDLKAELHTVRSNRDDLEAKYEETVKELERTKSDLSCFWREHEHTVSELQTAKMQRNDMEKKLEKKEESLVRARQEVVTLKKVINLSTSMVSMQRDHAVTAVAEKDMELKSCKEKIEKLKAELLKSKQREQQSLKASQSEINVLQHKLSSVATAKENKEEDESVRDDLVVSPDSATDAVNSVHPFAPVPIDPTKIAPVALTPIKRPFTATPLSHPTGPRTPISPSYSKFKAGKAATPGKENNENPLLPVPMSTDSKTRTPNSRVAFTLVDALINTNIKSINNKVE